MSEPLRSDKRAQIKRIIKDMPSGTVFDCHHIAQHLDKGIPVRHAGGISQMLKSMSERKKGAMIRCIHVPPKNARTKEGRCEVMRFEKL